MSTGLDVALIQRRAARVLRENDLGTMIAAAPSLYPHQWSWDAAFIAIGLCRVDVPRAAQELRHLLRGQWSTGMIPHIQFSDTPGYFPDPDRWGTAGAQAAPAGVATSGICQPPVHAIAVAEILAQGRARGGADEQVATALVQETFGPLLAWHRWLARVRDPDQVGMIEIHHGWESGWDNSPRWDEAYAAVEPGPMEGFVRRDIAHVADASERPSDAEYAKYLWLLEQKKQVRWRDEDVAHLSFRVRDVFFTAVYALANQVLAGIAADLGRSAEQQELTDLATRFEAGVAATVGSDGGARDQDARTGRWGGTDTLASFAPLVCSTDPALRGTQRRRLLGDDWCAHPDLRWPLPPSTSPASPAFRPRTYWRGPVWPFMNWFLGWCMRRAGDEELYASWRTASLEQLADLLFGEYYEPFTGEALGSHDQSWTAGAALAWIVED